MYVYIIFYNFECAQLGNGADERKNARTASRDEEMQFKKLNVVCMCINNYIYEFICATSISSSSIQNFTSLTYMQAKKKKKKKKKK